MKVSNAQRQPKGKQMHHYQTTNWRLIKSQMVFFSFRGMRIFGVSYYLQVRMEGNFMLS